MSEPRDQLQIRDYRPDDFPRLHQIDFICFPQGIAYSQSELLFYLRHADSITRVAQWRTGIVGFVVGQVEKGAAGHVFTLDVIPGARRRKVGTALMEALHDEFGARDVRMSYLEVDVSNSGAQRFYEKLSYVRVEILKGYYNGCSDAYRMVRIRVMGERR